MEEKSEYQEVADFYAGKSVFITGGTGYVGLVTIEKLLYSCVELDKIYLLVRDKYDVSASQRLQEITDNPLFTRLKDKTPHYMSKLIFVSGDITAPNLGISPEDEEILIDKVSVVIHVAANVKFNKPLNEILKINVGGTKKVLDLCKRMNNLKVFIHISTAYANTDKAVLNEVVYPPPAELDEVYKIVNQHDYDEKDLQILNGQLNTYTFSKALAETLVERNCINAPVIIVRPSIVTPIKDGPLKGWVNNWYGVTALLFTTAKGLNRCLYGSRSNIVDLIPVDYVANLIIVSGAKTDRSNKLTVYNCCSSSCNPITLGFFFDIYTTEAAKDGANVLPYPEVFFCSNHAWIISILTCLLQKIPISVIGALLWFQGKKPRYSKLQSHINLIRDDVNYFTSHSWVMHCTGIRSLFASLSSRDRQIFPCDPTYIRWDEYIRVYYKGVKQYLVQRR